MLTVLTVGAFVATKDQFWVAYHVTILFAFLLVLQVCFLPETLYPRALFLSKIDTSTSEKDGSVISGTDVIDIKRTKMLGYFVSCVKISSC